jgi:hypothetical protein
MKLSKVIHPILFSTVSAEDPCNWNRNRNRNRK